MAGRFTVRDDLRAVFADFDFDLLVAIWFSFDSMTASWAATDTTPPIGGRGERRVVTVAIREAGGSVARWHSADDRPCRSAARYPSKGLRLGRHSPPARRPQRLFNTRGLVQFGMNLSQNDPDGWLDRGTVHGGLLLEDHARSARSGSRADPEQSYGVVRRAPSIL